MENSVSARYPVTYSRMLVPMTAIKNRTRGLLDMPAKTKITSNAPNP
jgi:hypothetical protein